MAGAALTVDLNANLANFQKGMDQANRSLDKLEKNTAEANRSMKRMEAAGALAGKALVGLFAAAKIKGFVEDTARWADALDNAAGRVGVGVEQLQALRREGERFGSSIQATDTALQRFSRRLGEVRAGGAKGLATILAQANISLYDQSGALRSVTDVLGDYQQLLRGAADESERNRLAMAAFDSEGVKFGQTLAASNRTIAEMTDNLKAQNAVISKESVAAWDRFHDAVDTYTANIGGFLKERSGQWLRLLQAGWDRMRETFKTSDLETELAGLSKAWQEATAKVNANPIEPQVNTALPIKEMEKLKKAIEEMGQTAQGIQIGEELDLGDVWAGIRQLTGSEEPQKAADQFYKLKEAIEQLRQAGAGGVELDQTERQLKSIAKEKFNIEDVSGWEQDFANIQQVGVASFSNIGKSAEAAMAAGKQAVVDMTAQMQQGGDYPVRLIPQISWSSDLVEAGAKP